MEGRCHDGKLGEFLLNQFGTGVVHHDQRNNHHPLWVMMEIAVSSVARPLAARGDCCSEARTPVGQVRELFPISERRHRCLGKLNLFEAVEAPFRSAGTG